MENDFDFFYILLHCENYETKSILYFGKDMFFDWHND